MTKKTKKTKPEPEPRVCPYCLQTGGDTVWADEIGEHCSLCTPFPGLRGKDRDN